MNRRNLIAVLTCSFFALAIVATLISSGLSQSTGKGKSWASNKSDSARQARRAAMKESDKVNKDTLTGWLILDGELIPGPYEVVVVIQDSSILVNGIVAVSPAPQSEPIVVDSKYVAHHTFAAEQNVGYDSVYIKKGEAAAKKWAYEFSQNHPLVDTVYYSRGGDLVIKFVDEKYEEHITFLPPAEKLPNHEEMEEMFRKNLQSIGERLRGSLSHGSLVIKSSISWGGATIPFPRSKLVIDELKRICATISDLEERVAAIKKVIGNDDQAQLIAERFLKGMGEDGK